MTNPITYQSLCDVFGSRRGHTLYKKFRNKQENARRRGLEFSLDIYDAIELGLKLEGSTPEGCDYTGLPFDNRVKNSPANSSLERIDDSLGYVRGNLCVVRRDANELKDRLWDKVGRTLKTTTLSEEELPILKCMIERMSSSYLESLKMKYVPSNAIGEKCVEKDIQGIDEKTEKLSQEESTPRVTDIPEDVVTAEKYSALIRFLVKSGKGEISLTFNQFKMVYSVNKCFITGAPLGESKLPVILDLSKPIAYGNIRFAESKAADALNHLMEATGLSAQQLVNNIKKVTK